MTWQEMIMDIFDRIAAQLAQVLEVEEHVAHRDVPYHGVFYAVLETCLDSGFKVVHYLRECGDHLIEMLKGIPPGMYEHELHAVCTESGIVLCYLWKEFVVILHYYGVGAYVDV